MSSSRLPVGSFVATAKQQMQTVIDRLQELGYRTVGPQVADGAIIYDEVDSIDQLSRGVLDVQDGGLYQLKEDDGAGWFDHTAGPHSLKNYVFPPRETLIEAERDNGRWQMRQANAAVEPVAVIGARSCDLHALEVQDRVFLKGPYVDPTYQARREALFLCAVNCRRAGATCFCHSMKTGPNVKSSFDLLFTELDDCFIIEVGSQQGGQVIAATDWAPCRMDQVQEARQQPRKLAEQMASRPSQSSRQPKPRSLDTTDIRDLLLSNLEHPQWEKVADRCLACANCTMVCPTCFCSSVEEVADLTSDHVTRQRSWASCFTAEHSYMNTGLVRKSIAARYRQWLTHKLASWIDQFGVSGCVGCGRCITWCPVGIDITEEVAAIREGN